MCDHNHVNDYDEQTCDALQADKNRHLTSFNELPVSRVIYRETMPELKQNINIGEGVRAVVEQVEGDVIGVFAATPGKTYGENMKLRVIALTPEQRAFVDLVRNSMITGFLTLTDRMDEVRAACFGQLNRSVHEILSELLGDQPVSFLAVRPFEVTEIQQRLKELWELEDRLVD